MKRAAFALVALLAFGQSLAAVEAILDLEALPTAKAPQTHMTLRLTCPGGGATSYDIRYSTSLITSANFSSASVAGTRTVTGAALVPSTSGVVQSTEILGLSPNTTYYFAMKSSDGVTPSILSNVASRATSKYEGYGSVVTGGGDGTIYRVTTLNDTGTGSLRGCIFSRGNSCSTPLSIIFTVGGKITLLSDINIEENQCKMTIDGSTAPSPGITIGKQPCASGYTTCPPSGTACLDVGEFVIGQENHLITSNIILTYLRFHGNYQSGWGYCDSDSSATLGAQYGFSDLVWDHLTVRNGSDSSPDIWSGLTQSHTVTLSNSLIAWSNHAQLISSSHPDGSASRDELSIFRNVYARCGQRMPLIVGKSTNVDFRNNVVFDWSSDWTGHTGGDGTQIQPFSNDGGATWLRPTINIVNNYYIAGRNGTNLPSLGLFYGDRAGGDAVDGGPSGCTAQGQIVTNSHMGEMWTAGNIFPPANCDRFSTVSAERTIPAADKVTTITAENLMASLLPDVGTHYRLSDETAILNEIGPTGTVCGNGVREGSEVCDGTDFGTDSCVAHGFASGELACFSCTSVGTLNCRTSGIQRSVLKGVTIKGATLP